MNLSLRTEVWEKGHHPWKGGKVRNEDTGQRAKEYYQLRTKPTGKGIKGRMQGLGREDERSPWYHGGQGKRWSRTGKPKM